MNITKELLLSFIDSTNRNIAYAKTIKALGKTHMPNMIDCTPDEYIIAHTQMLVCFNVELQKFKS